MYVQRGLDLRIPPVFQRPKSLCVDTIETWGPSFRGAHVVVYCGDGGSLSQGVAAWLRNEAVKAEVLSGGFDAWLAAAQPLLRTAIMPARDVSGRTVWVTRMRPKIIRIACPWLIRRFIDPDARFLFVAAAEVTRVAALQCDAV